MAKTKRRAPRRRRKSRTMSESGLSRRGARKGKRRSTRRRKTGLSEMMTHEGFKKAGTSSLSGAIGGLASYGIDALVGRSGWGQGGRFLAQAAGALILAGGMDKPNMAAGMTGAYAYSLMDQAMPLSEMEDTDYADEESLEEYPDALDEDGNAMYLAEDGNFYYLEEFELAEDGQYYLSEGSMQADLYPGYVNPNA